MRLPVAALLLMAAGGCGSSVTHAVSTRVHVYDDARLTVVSPAARDEVRSGDTVLRAEYVVDAVSGATQALTVDAVSSATRFSEERHQLGVSGAHAFSAELELSGGYSLSFEPDHTVHAPSLGITAELMERMVRASARYQLLAESIGKVDEPAFSSAALGHRLDLGWTHIASTTLVITALATTTAYRCGANLGCFANPYRYVGVDGRSSEPVALRERHPDARFTGAGALRVAWALADDGALHAGYRFAADSWGVRAHTADAAAVTEWFEQRLLVRAEARGTVQHGASFYESSYRRSDTAVPAYRSADAELSSLWNIRLQLHLEWTWGPLRLVGELGRIWNRYPEFPALPSRPAWIGGVGIDADL